LVSLLMVFRLVSFMVWITNLFFHSSSGVTQRIFKERRLTPEKMNEDVVILPFFHPRARRRRDLTDADYQPKDMVCVWWSSSVLFINLFILQLIISWRSKE